MSSLPKDEKTDDADIQVQDVPGLTFDDEDVGEADQAYLNASKFTKFYRSSLFQIIVLGALSFVGPSMTDAIGLLGGGGLSSPYLANLATSVNYAASCVMALCGGPVINKLGIKWSCVIGATGYVLAGSGYYAQARYGNSAYLISARVIGGFTNAFLYVGESTAMLSYPQAHERGKYLGIWTAMRNSGSIIGGAINFGNNHTDSKAGGIAWATYIVFIAFESSGFLISQLLSPTSKVRRTDGTRVPGTAMQSWKQEFTALIKHLRSPRIWLMFMPSFYSFYYGGTYNTYLSLHFSVRARALSSMLTPIVTLVTVLMYGLMLDSKRFSQKQKAWMAFFGWLIPQAGCFIWTGVLYGQWGQHTSYHAYDYELDGAQWAKAYLPYLIVYTTGYWTQLSLYWILGTFSTDSKSSARTGGLFRAFETAGSAVTYAVNSSSGDKRVPLYLNCAFLALTIPSMVGLIRLVPETPSEVDDVADAPVTTAVQKAEVAAM